MIRREGDFGEEKSRETSFLSFPSQSVSPSLVRLTMKSALGVLNKSLCRGAPLRGPTPYLFIDSFRQERCPFY